MGFLTNLFGGETNIWTIAFALIIVIVLIVAGVWLLKLLANASGTIARGKQRRLSLVETIALDNKRNLVLIRRDDIEHLLVISSNTETVVETGIHDGPASNSQAKPHAPAAQEPPNPLAQTSLAAAAVAAVAAKSATPKSAPTRRSANTATKSTRERFGLSRLLRRAAKPNNEPKVEHPLPVDFHPDNSNLDDSSLDNSSAQDNSVPIVEVKTEDTPNDKSPPSNNTNAPQIDNASKSGDKKAPSSLRHTGLLMPISKMVEPGSGEEKPANEDNNKPSDTDSDMNKVEEIDDQAMESIEEGADSGDESIKATRNDDDKTFDDIEDDDSRDDVEKSGEKTK